jgi:hypothetical protein
MDSDFLGRKKRDFALLAVPELLDHIELPFETLALS